MKHRLQPLLGVLQNRFYDTLTLNKFFKNIENTCEPAVFSGKNWQTCNFTIAEVFHKKTSNICDSNILRNVNTITAEFRQTKM